MTNMETEIKMLRITNDYIINLKPCEELCKNYLSFYKDTDFSIKEFLTLENISYSDKIWVWRRFATVNDMALFALKCAESVQLIYETWSPNIAAARELLCFMRTIPDFENISGEDRAQLKVLRRAVAVVYANASADATTAAAAAAAADAAFAAADSDAGSADAAADAVAFTAADAAADRQMPRQANLSFLIEIYEGR